MIQFYVNIELNKLAYKKLMIELKVISDSFERIIGMTSLSLIKK